MKQMIAYAENNNLDSINNLLEKGWKVKEMKSSFRTHDTSAACGGGYSSYQSNSKRGDSTLYVLLEKEE